MSKFRAEGSNVRYTKALFLEESYSDKSHVLYTLKDSDHEGYKSLYLCYIYSSDPTEINFANEYFEGWEHWQMIANASWFKPFIARWREELELRMRASALSRIQQVAEDATDKNSFAANRYILSGDWSPKQKGGVGRTTKEAIKQKAEELFAEKQNTDEDYKRIIQ